MIHAAKTINNNSEDISGVFSTDASRLKFTAVYYTYWQFAVERQNIFFRKLQGQTSTLTNDQILRKYRFTNAYRASDRVSQYLIKNVIYEGEESARELFFRIILFRTFNRIETWELLLKELGEVSYSKNWLEHYDKVISNAFNSGCPIYSAAYIMPSGSGEFKDKRKHRSHLRLLDAMIKDELPAKITEMKTMGSAFHLLKSYQMIGDFLAFQYVIDLNYSPLTNFSEMEFVMAGPGAKSGIKKCFSESSGLSDNDLIRYVADRQEEEFARLGLDFNDLWGRRLQLVDCQNLFCEIDKYSRVAYPEIESSDRRRRIKQLYTPKPEIIKYWYPPKWGINEKIPEYGRVSCLM